MDVEEPVFDRAPDERLAERRGEVAGEDRDDVESHASSLVQKARRRVEDDAPSRRRRPRRRSAGRTAPRARRAASRGRGAGARRRRRGPSRRPSGRPVAVDGAAALDLPVEDEARRAAPATSPRDGAESKLRSVSAASGRRDPLEADEEPAAVRADASRCATSRAASPPGLQRGPRARRTEALREVRQDLDDDLSREAVRPHDAADDDAVVGRGRHRIVPPRRGAQAFWAIRRLTVSDALRALGDPGLRLLAVEVEARRVLRRVVVSRAPRRSSRSGVRRPSETTMR